MNKGIGSRLRKLRDSLGMKNQTEFAEALGITQTLLSKYETETVDIPDDLKIKISEFGVNLHWLISGNGEVFLFNEPEKPQKMGIASYLIDGEVSLFRFSHGRPTAVPARNADPNALVMVPIYSQPAAAGKGQPPTQLAEIEAYIPVIFELLGGARPQNCGIVRVVGDSMTDMTLFNGDLVIFDRSQLEGNGVYVISMGDDVRVKRLEYRTFDQKIIISSENRKSYPEPEVITFEQAKEMLMIHGKVISWVHRHPY